MNISFYVPETSTTRQSQATLATPGTTLRHLLAIEDFRSADLLSGESALDRPIKGALALDPAGVLDHVGTGDLVVVPWSDQMTMDWWNGVIDKHATGVCLVGDGVASNLTEIVIRLLRDRHFPVLTLPMPRDFSRLLSAVASATRLEPSPSALALSVRLTQMALDGIGLEAIAKEISEALRAPVIVEDRQFNLLANAIPAGITSHSYDEILTATGTPVSTLKELEDSGTLRRLRSERGLLTIPANGQDAQARHLCPIVIAGEIMGYLSCLDLDGTAGAMAPEFLLASANGVSIELLKQKGIAENEQKLRRDFFRDLLFSNGNITPETLHRRATYLGYQLSSAYWSLVVEFDNVPNEELLPDEVKKLVSSLNSLLSFRQALVITQIQGATILYPIKEGQPTLDKIKHLSETIRQKISGATAGWTLSIGVGQLYNDLLSIPRSYREAQHAVKIGRALHGTNSITCFTELGIYRMLLQFAQSQNPNEFFCEALQRLLEYDQQADKELVKTLTAFLECNGNLTETSDRLFIHRNTLKYRLERIRDITQIDLDDSENRLVLHLGLKMNQIVTTIQR